MKVESWLTMAKRMILCGDEGAMVPRTGTIEAAGVKGDQAECLSLRRVWRRVGRVP